MLHAHQRLAPSLFLVLFAALLPLAARAAAQELRNDEFRTKFKQAQQINAVPEMGRLISRYNDEAVAWIIDTAEGISRNPTAELYERLDDLRKGWAETQKSEFVNEVEKYFSLLSPGQKRQRSKLLIQYDKKFADYLANLADNDGPKYNLLGLEFEGLAKGWEQVGDLYYASQCWGFVGQCHDEGRRGESADLKKATKAFGECLRLREELGLLDRMYKETRPRYMALVGQGHGDEPAADRPGAKGQGGAEGEAGKDGVDGATPTAPSDDSAEGIELSFELVEDIHAYERPSFNQDDIYPIWAGIALKEIGSTAVLPRLKDSPTVHRTGAGEVKIDMDRDGVAEVDVPLTGNMEPIAVTLGQGDDVRPWGMLAIIGSDRDTYQGIEVNLGLTDQGLLLYIFPAASLVGSVDGTRVRLFDDHFDGVFGGPSLTYGWPGLTKDHFSPEMDSIVIGKDDRARPWSRLQKIEDVWYELEVLEGGTRLSAQPEELKTGRMKLAFKGGKPKWVVVAGQGEKGAGLYFDLVEGGSKGVEVPVGEYALYYGELRKGSKRQEAKTIILAGDETPRWKVEEGQTVEVKLGAPFGFDFDFEVEGDSFTVIGNSVVVTGVADERYERAWGTVPHPEVAFRVAGSRRGGKAQRMDAINSPEALYASEWVGGWFPVDTTFDKGKGTDPIEVQLTEKKNKLFGKVESAWKGND